MAAHVPFLFRRLAGLVLAIILALNIVAVTPNEARAHDSCAIAQPVATGVLGSLLAAVNVFSTFVETSTVACTDKYAEVDAKMTRDWQAADDDPEDPFDPSQARRRGNTPSTAARCVEGMAADFFPCDNVDMLSHVSHAELGTTFVNDVWGWTDPKTGNDYALLGASNGTVFVDISDPQRPEVLGRMPTASTSGGSSWRDIKVYRNHAYVVSEHNNHGVQVFDLKRLRGWDGEYEQYEPDARYTGHGSAHNININEETGFAYSVGAGPFYSQGLPYTVTVNSASGQESYLANGASFGPAPTQEGLTGAFALADDGSTEVPGNPDAVGTTSDGCQPFEVPEGAIAIADRGACAFVDKARNAQAGGAVALVVVNTADTTQRMGGGADDVDIPSVMVSSSDGQAIKDSLPADGGITANDPPAECGTGLHMIDISSPKSPEYAGCYQDDGYIHDTQCVVYEGPDAAYRDREICFNSNGIEYALDGQNFVSIVDVTDKEDPKGLSRLEYEGSGYSHQGWLTEDQQFFLHGDEGDEILAGVNTTTRVWDVSDLDAPEVHEVFVNDTTSIDHNLYTKGRYATASNYTTGLRVYDTRDVATTGLREVGYFDIYPENDNASFEGGTWSNYPYFRQKGIVAVSSIDRGLFILQPRLGRTGG
jgi:hypothetical protein